jgi:hypothetical protein
MFKNKVVSEDRSLDATFLKETIRDYKTEDSRMFQFLKEELKEIRESQETLKEQIIETKSGIRIKLKIQTSFELIMRANRKVFVEVLSEGSNLEDFSIDDFREMLSFAFENNVQSLLQYLDDFKDDTLRTAILYPSSCDDNCIVSYQGLFLIWTKAIKKVFKAWNKKFKYYLNCDRKRWKMAQKFNQVISRYRRPIQIQLKKYFKYMVVDQICNFI